MSVFDITCDERSLEVLTGSTKTISLTVTNRETRPITALLSMRVKGGTPPGIRFVHDPQISFGSGATNVVSVALQADVAANPGPFSLTSIIASEHDSDETFSSVDFAVQVVKPADRPKNRWWLWLIMIACVIAICASSFYIAWSLKSNQAARIPDVLGLSLGEAREAMKDAGFELILLPTTTEDLDSRQFRERTSAYLKSLPEATQNNDLTDETTNADDDAKNDAKNPSLAQATNSIVISEEPTLENRFVWYVDGDRFSEIGSEIGVKVAPELINLPIVNNLNTLQATEALADAGLRFRVKESLPTGYRYGQDNSATIWSIEPPGPKVFHGSIIHMQVMPDTIPVPDFSNATLDDLLKHPEINAVFIYKLTSKQNKQTTDMAVLQSWARLLANQLSIPYVYRQIPTPGTLIPRGNHTVTIYLDAKRVSQ